MLVCDRIFSAVGRPMPYTYGSENATCLSRGMSTPAMRAIVLLLALPLLVLLGRADHAQLSVAPDDLALVATTLD